MSTPFAPRRPVFDAAAPCREGRDSELARRTTALVLCPRSEAAPGGWLLLLAASCTYVAVRALELTSAF
ncbi:hypothetical protein JJB11_03480 [Ramlibacter ginsenosidimutans]|uniref:Uncharacterized protein n=1 Tax=Ramlibacter ginsenosidimutans TaxID=502333 RepID=A0A934TPX2_9BURK|nr:hypothetical protein [Ramlibacter ginsenosidimutans]MBK6005143.1 hypothetical protein [Ramlibacter ginsenosidimutans]